MPAAVLAVARAVVDEERDRSPGSAATPAAGGVWAASVADRLAALERGAGPDAA